MAFLVRQVDYLIHKKRNLQNLKTEVDELLYRVKKVDELLRGSERLVEGTVDEFAFKVCKTKVDAVTEESDKYLRDESHSQTCLPRLCPNPVRRYQLSRNSRNLEHHVAKLIAEINDINHDLNCVIKQQVSEMSLIEKKVSKMSEGVHKIFRSRISIVDQIMDELKNSDSTHMILVSGMIGVGKTTIVEEVRRKSQMEKIFEIMLMVRDVKQNQDLKTIQKEIATQLHLDVLDDQTPDQTAHIIRDTIKDKKTLVVLYDVGERIDLVAMGLPKLVTCKILLTSKSGEILPVDNRTHIHFPLNILNDDESWKLFEGVAGNVVKTDGQIRNIAPEVAKTCGGLPVSVVIVARALKNRTALHTWEEALRSLQQGVDNEELRSLQQGVDNEELKKKAYSALKWSYTQLQEEELTVLLLCGQTLWRNTIFLNTLLKYCIGLGLLRNVDTLEEAQNSLHSLVRKLIDRSLLLDGEDNTCARMHDLVQDVATSVAYRVEHVLSVGPGNEFKEWPATDFLEKCTRISLDCCSIPQLPQVLRCPKLNMFVLGGEDNYSLKIPSSFFEEMQKLRVLDLTNIVIPKLPVSLLFLKSTLQCLCLDRCTLDDVALVGELRKLEILSFMNSRITKLPKEIEQLTCLRLLDLDNCSRLEVIPPNVLSRLQRLEDLSMRNSFKQWEGGVTGERSNANLSELKNLSRLAALEIHIPNADILPTDLFSSMRLERYQILIGDAWKQNEMCETTLNTLKLKLSANSGLDKGLNDLLKRSQVLYLDGTKGVYPLNSRKVSLANLTTLSVDNGCDGSKFLLSSSIARALVQLKHLRISKCAIIEEIVSSKQEYGEDKAGNMFCKLEHLELRDLPNLARFCSADYIELVDLKNLDLENCPKLGAFVSDPMSENTTIRNEIEEMDSNEIKVVDVSRTAAQYFLFSEKVHFPWLERLTIDGLSKLMSVWHNQISLASFCQLSSIKVKRCGSLINIVNETHDSSTTELKSHGGQNLFSVKIGNCDSLKSIFPASIAGGLKELQKMEVVYCEVLEVIIAKDDQLQPDMPFPRFLFPKATSVEFRHLPMLSSFYPGMHVSWWPLLEELEVYGCHKMKAFAAEFIEYQKNYYEFDHLCVQPLFIIDQNYEHSNPSFSKLEYLTLQMEALEIWCGPAPEKFFGKLKCIDFYWSAPFTQQAAVSFLQKLHNLEQIEVGYGPFQELFVDEVNDSEAVQALPNVTTLRLDTMYNLRHLGKEKSDSGGPVFPNLKILDVKFCQRLKNLESSAISFRNLTTMKVHYCAKLEYLLTSSVAKSLMQLTRLEVVDCERMTEIISASNGDEGDNAGGTFEIDFSRLEHLQLQGLPRLQGFCSGNSFVKFPSSKVFSMSDRRLILKFFPHDELPSSTDYRLDCEVDDEEPNSGVNDEEPELEFDDEESESEFDDEESQETESEADDNDDGNSSSGAGYYY